MTPLFVSFYTLGTAYEREAVDLAESLEAFGLDYRIEGVPNLGDWCHNCARKASFVRDQLQKNPCRAVVWTDADSRVMQPPILFDSLDCDVAFHLKDGHELLSGTIYFGPTEAARELASLWADACREQPGVWDQQRLQFVIDANPGRWKIEHIPSTYCEIFDSMASGNPVILHLQASRKGYV
jgi:hypothetical protein